MCDVRACVCICLCSNDTAQERKKKKHKSASTHNIYGLFEKDEMKTTNIQTHKTHFCDAKRTGKIAEVGPLLDL